MADRAIAGLMILCAGVIGGSCLLAALILLLHGWMVWWQCFAIGGVVTIVCALAVNASMKGSSVPAESKKS
jgi:MFS family permease